MNSPEAQRVLDLMNSPEAQRARDLMNSPEIQRTRELMNSPEIQRTRELMDSPAVQKTIEAVKSAGQSHLDFVRKIIETPEMKKQAEVLQRMKAPEAFQRQADIMREMFDSSYIRDAVDLILTQFASLSFFESEEFQRIIRDEGTREAFAFAGLFPSLYTDESLRLQVVAARKSGKTATYIQRLVLSHYDAQNAEQVSKIVMRLNKNPWFEGREPVLSQTLTAHRQELDAISTYPLAAMIEGVLRRYLMAIEDQLGLPGKPEDRKLVGFKQVLQETLYLTPYTGGLSGASVAKEYFEEHVAANFKWPNPPQEDVADEELHRHPLLHGHSLGGSRLNTLRCFLMLDFIAAMMVSVP